MRSLGRDESVFVAHATRRTAALLAPLLLFIGSAGLLPAEEPEDAESDVEERVDHRGAL